MINECYKKIAIHTAKGKMIKGRGDGWREREREVDDGYVCTQHTHIITQDLTLQTKISSWVD